MERKKKPLEHTALLVLSLLKGQDLYGYQMITELERRSDHTFQMREGTLYPVLKKLENSGYVTSYQAEANGRTRKYYHITKKGLRLLNEKKEEWTTFSQAVNAILAGSNPALA